MKQYIPLLCTIVICLTAVYLWQQYEKHENTYNRYWYPTNSSNLKRIDKETGRVEVYKIVGGWLTLTP